MVKLCTFSWIKNNEMKELRAKVELAVNTALEKGEQEGIELSDESIVEEIVIALKSDDEEKSSIEFGVMLAFLKEGEISYLDVVDSVIDSLKEPTSDCSFDTNTFDDFLS